MKKRLLILILVLSFGLFIGLKIKIDRIPRAKIPGASIIYVPSGKYLKFATFGYSSLMADMIYLWAIQYFSSTDVPDRYKYVDHVFSIIAELDPRYLDPYEVGAIVAIYEAGDMNAGFKILDRGLEKNPDQWIFPFEAGHYAQMVKKDYSLAQHYYKKVMDMKGAPDIARRLYANTAFKQADFATAWENWLDIYKEAEKEKDERITKIASNHLYQIKAAMDVRILNGAVKKFHERYRRYPQDLSELVRMRFLPSLPQDLDREDYLYDPAAGKVRPPTIPWKR